MTTLSIHDRPDLGVLNTGKHPEAAVNTSGTVRPGNASVDPILSRVICHLG